MLSIKTLKLGIMCDIRNRQDEEVVLCFENLYIAYCSSNHMKDGFYVWHIRKREQYKSIFLFYISHWLFYFEAACCENTLNSLEVYDGQLVTYCIP